MLKYFSFINSQWQETEDFGRKKEIRQHMYKLRESRLKDFYTNEMDTKNTFNPKAPITSRHGDAMADHSFESFKSQEIRDSKSPTRYVCQHKKQHNNRKLLNLLNDL